MAADKLKEEVGAGGIDGQVADLVDDASRTWCRSWSRASRRPSAMAGEAGNEGSRGDEQDPIATLNGLEAEADAEVGFATPGGRA